MAGNWELGSNFSVGIGGRDVGGLKGMAELVANFEKLIKIMSGPALREALWDGAEVVKTAIEAATPRGGQYPWGPPSSWNGKQYYSKDKHPGQARDSVIIYQRQAKTYYSGGLFSSALTKGSYAESQGALSLLVGYEKRRAYYMYWVQHGWTPTRAGDVIVRTRAGGVSQTKHFRPEDLYFPAKSTSKSTKGAWGKKQFGKAVATMEATGGGKPVGGRDIIGAAFASAESAVMQVIEDRLRAVLSGIAA